MSGMSSSSSICSHFSQNAWKKDLCSNCFKSKDEHRQSKSHTGGVSAVATHKLTDHSNHPVKMVATAASTHPPPPPTEQRSTASRQQKPVKSIIKKSPTHETGNSRQNNSVANGGGSRRKSSGSKVSFPKNVSEVIGYGGEWNDSDDEHDFMNFDNDTEDEKLLLSEDDESLELSRITRANTDFNMKNGNLLGEGDDAQKKSSFTPLKLGATQVDKEGKKQTLQINVTPFGAGSIKTGGSSSKAVKEVVKDDKDVNRKSDKVENSRKEKPSSTQSTVAKSSNTAVGSGSSMMVLTPRSSATDGADSPPLERAMEKSLLDEISETLEKKQQQQQQQQDNTSNQSTANRETTCAVANKAGTGGLSKIKFEIGSLTESLEQKTFLDALKKPIVRNTPIAKDQIKPKVNVFHKFSDSESICSDHDNGISAYYDVVDTTIPATAAPSIAETSAAKLLEDVSYENLPDGKYERKKGVETGSGHHGSITITRRDNNGGNNSSITAATGATGSAGGGAQMNTIFSTSQYIADMLLSSKTRAASYNLHDGGNVLTSQITSDGLVVTKCTGSDDALDSTSSSFDGSSDEETHYNMIRSESDSGIGISLTNDYKNLPQLEQERRPDLPKLTAKLSVSTNNSDYEDIQVNEQKPITTAETSTKSSEGVVSMGASTSSTHSNATNTSNSNSTSTDKDNSNLGSDITIEKSRELHGEPDGSADPDGKGCLESKIEKSLQLPALPKSPPPTKVNTHCIMLDSRPSFLHGKVKQQQQFNILGKKPDLPAKPVIIGNAGGATSATTTTTASSSGSSNIQASIKTFLAKKLHHDNTEKSGASSSCKGSTAANTNTNMEQQTKDDLLKLKKGKAPNPPPPPSNAPIQIGTNHLSLVAEMKLKALSNARNKDDKGVVLEDDGPTNGDGSSEEVGEVEQQSSRDDEQSTAENAGKKETTKEVSPQRGGDRWTDREVTDGENTSCKVISGSGTMSKAMAGQVLREKEKRERGIINPKFRSLNTFVMQRSNVLRNLHLQNAIPINQSKSASNATVMNPSGPVTGLKINMPAPERTLTDLNLKHSSSGGGLKNQLSMSEECLTESSSNCAVSGSLSITNLAGIGGEKSKANGKTKSKFSIKKFLRMGSSSGSSGSGSGGGSGGSANITASTTKSNENFLSRKKDNGHVYSEICTGEEANVVGKPRLVIIHPIDMNPTALEVVKGDSITANGCTVPPSASPKVKGGNSIGSGSGNGSMVTGKPPAPPMRSVDGQRAHELNKPARPPPPKSAELRRKQTVAGTFNDAPLGTLEKVKNHNGSINTAVSMGTTSTVTGGRMMEEATNGSIKSKADNVYANLGEIRSSMAPRKPERTASMREREAQLEIARKRSGNGDRSSEAGDTISICSSNGDKVITGHQHQLHSLPHHNQQQQQQQQQQQLRNPPQISTPNQDLYHNHSAPSSGNFERSQKYEIRPLLSNKLEIFDATGSTTTTTTVQQQQRNNISSVGENRCNILKDSVRKITHTIDSYLKDKQIHESSMYDTNRNVGGVKQSPPPPPARGLDLPMSSGGGCGSNSQQQSLGVGRPRRSPLFSSDSMSIASYTRSEYLPANTRSYGFHNSIANLPRMVSSSYCGSELGDMEAYAPYSYYGSEAGPDVGRDTLGDSVWGLNSSTGNKNNRTKTVNRLRMRKGRSVVHKTIEDNYSAVVGANHEALAQVLEQLQQTPAIPPALRTLGNAINLRFEDFAVLDGVQAFVVGRRAFHAALWNTTPVTLALSADCQQLAGVGGELNQLSGGVSGALNPITEFCDLVPSYHLPLMPSTEVTLLQATISVLPRLQLDTLQSIGMILRNKSQALEKSQSAVAINANSSNNTRGSIPNLNTLKEINGTAMALRNGASIQNLSTLHEQQQQQQQQQEQQQSTQQQSLKDENYTGNEETPVVSNSQRISTLTTNTSGSGISAFDDIMTREVAFIMLQLINGMKNLQVNAVEEMPLSLSNVVLAKEVDNKEAQARLCVLQGNQQHDEDEAAMGTLCKCAYVALTEMLPNTKITAILRDILVQERSESLSKSKSVLEFVLWGPSDVVLSGSTKEREMALQRWLDLERATVLHGLVRTRIELTVYDECHLMFLVRSTAKIMNDAAKIINNYQQQL